MRSGKRSDEIFAFGVQLGIVVRSVDGFAWNWIENFVAIVANKAFCHWAMIGHTATIERRVLAAVRALDARVIVARVGNHA